MEISLNFISNNWEFFITAIFIPFSIFVVKKYKKHRIRKEKYNVENWRLIKSTKKVSKTDFNVPHSYQLMARPSDNLVKKNILENKKNVIFIGDNNQNIKYGKSSLLYSILKKKQLKKHIVFIPNLAKVIKSEDEIDIPTRWLEKKKRNYILIIEDLNNYIENIKSLLFYYRLLEKKSTSLFFIFTTDVDYDIDWGEREIEITKIKLAPIDKINDKDSKIIISLNQTYNSLENISKKILSYIKLYEKIGLATNEEYIYKIIEFHETNNIEKDIFRENVFVLEATGFIVWKDTEIKLRKSIINPDFSNYDFIKQKNIFDIDKLKKFFINIKNIGGLYHLSDIYLEKNNFEEVKIILKKILEIDLNATKAKFLFAQMLLKEYNYLIKEKKQYSVEILDNALHWYIKAIEGNKNYYLYKLSYAYGLIKRGQSPLNTVYQKKEYFDKAERVIEQTKNSINLNDYAYNYAYAFLYKKLKKLNLSLEYYKVLIRINYSQYNYKLFTEYAELLLLINKKNLKLNYIDEIEKYLLLAEKAKPRHYYKTNHILANFYSWCSRNPKLKTDKKKRFIELSIMQYDKSYENSNKKHLQSLKGKAKLLISSNMLDDAINVLKDIISIDSNDFYSLKSIGTAYTKKKEIEKAIFYYIKSIEKLISLNYIKTLQEINDRKYPQLFKEVNSLSDNKKFIECLKNLLNEIHEPLVREFINNEIVFAEISIINNEIKKITHRDNSIEEKLLKIKKEKFNDFKKKTLALYYIKIGDIERDKIEKISLYKKAKSILLSTYKKRRRKPQSYYKHLIVIDAKLSLINNNDDYVIIINKFRKQIEFADNRYAEIHFEFAKYLDKLMIKRSNLRVGSIIEECITQYKISVNKFNSYNFEEIEYCIQRINNITSTSNKV